MKKKIIISISMLLIILICYLIYDYNKEDLKERCTNSNNLSYINRCMERANIYPQEQYDAYYNVAKNNPSLSILNDNSFYQGFRLAYNNCEAYATKNECNIHDGNVIKNFEYKCTMNTNMPLYCTQIYFMFNLPSEENLKYFLRIVKYEIEINKSKKYLPTDWSCNDLYKIFYSKIGTDLISLVPLDVQEACK